MVPAPGADEAIGILRRRPALPFGVHLTLVRDSGELARGPVAGRRAVPSLVDDTGDLGLAARAADLLARAPVDEVEVELRAQIAVVLDAGLAPTHLDRHCLADGGRADRSGDLAALTSPQVREAVQQEGIELIDYTDLRAGWVAAAARR